MIAHQPTPGGLVEEMSHREVVWVLGDAEELVHYVVHPTTLRAQYLPNEEIPVNAILGAPSPCLMG